MNEFDKIINEALNEPLEEDLKSNLAALGLAGAAAMGPQPAQADALPLHQPTTQTIRRPVPTRDWKGIVVHHTDSPEWTTVKHIDQWHKERGWDGVGYHFVIYPDGSIHQGRSLDKTGAHAKGRNSTHIGISLVGYDKFTTAQRNSLGKLTLALVQKYDIQSIERHHENCPGGGIDVEVLDNTLQNMRNEK